MKKVLGSLLASALLAGTLPMPGGPRPIQRRSGLSAKARRHRAVRRRLRRASHRANRR